MNDPVETGVYVYEVAGDSGPHYYLSLLPNEAVFASGLPSEAVVGELSRPNDLSPESFRPNPLFVQFLSQVFGRHANGCRELVAEAERQQDGVVCVIDKRTPTPRDAVPPEDIIGLFEVHCTF